MATMATTATMAAATAKRAGELAGVRGAPPHPAESRSALADAASSRSLRHCSASTSVYLQPSHTRWASTCTNPRAQEGLRCAHAPPPLRPRSQGDTRAAAAAAAPHLTHLPVGVGAREQAAERGALVAEHQPAAAAVVTPHQPAEAAPTAATAAAAARTPILVGLPVAGSQRRHADRRQRGRHPPAVVVAAPAPEPPPAPPRAPHQRALPLGGGCDGQHGELAASLPHGGRPRVVGRPPELADRAREQPAAVQRDGGGRSAASRRLLLLPLHRRPLAVRALDG